MAKSTRQPWLVATIIGAGYAAVGITFAIPSAHAQMWRLAAWAVSAVVYLGHICYERFRLRTSPTRAALHVALAAALGAFGLAVSANIHSLRLGSAHQHPPLLTLSLALWPLITAGPAYCIALITSWLLNRVSGFMARVSMEV
jgi:hypothetical protein